MDTQPLHKLWDEFLKTWPVERVRRMTIEEYTNGNRDDAFIYWIEKRLESLGSIWGGSAFKFGIYCRQEKSPKEPSGGRIFGDDYAWMVKYGQTEQQAFKNVLARILEIIDAVQAGNLDLIDEVDFSPAYKWKLAFLYQDRKNPRILPVYKKEWLFFHYREIDPSAQLSKVPYSLLYTSLHDRYRDMGDIFEIGKHIWENWEQRKEKRAKYWAVPVSWAIGEAEEALDLCEKTEITSDDVSPFLDKLLSDQELSEGDHMALLIEDNVRAVGTLTNVEPGEFSWSQIPVNFPSELVPVPTSEARELDASERKAIWDQVPQPPQKPQAETETAKIDVPPVEEEPEEPPEPSEPCIPKNIILYGPPGTGKTYSTVERALQLIMGEDKVRDMSHDTRMRQFRKLQQDGRVEFVTFHQAYGYEEFVEGLRPVLDTDAGNEVQYELHPGVFRRIALRAAAEGLKGQKNELAFDTLWAQLIKDLTEEGNKTAKSSTGKTFVLQVSGRGSIILYPGQEDEDGPVITSKDTWHTASKESVRLVWDHRNELGPEPEKITSAKTQKLFARERGGGGGHHYTAIWTVYCELFNLARTSSATQMDTSLRVQTTLDKKTPGLVDFKFSKESAQYVLIIDEINRGNISKILGELITLLEPDKRLGSPDELKLPLSYSPEHRFSVPPNLHIIGTMNTADRSIALMDVALRRRFSFEELMPDDSVIKTVLKKDVADEAFIDLVVEIFNTLNKRIRFLYDNDHQLGHAYFLSIRDYEDLRRIFLDRIIPLLQEYFYGAWDKICTVLGCPYNENGQPLRTGPVKNADGYVAPMIEAGLFEETETIGYDHEQYEDRLDFEVKRSFSKPGKPIVELLPFFLGILNLSQDDYQGWQTRCEAGSLLKQDEESEDP